MLIRGSSDLSAMVETMGTKVVDLFAGARHDDHANEQVSQTLVNYTARRKQPVAAQLELGVERCA